MSGTAVIVLQTGGGISLQRLEARQDAILSRLAQLKEAVHAYKESIGFIESSTGDSSEVSMKFSCPGSCRTTQRSDL